MTEPSSKQHAMYLGECFGTFLLVFIGTGSVACAVLFEAFSGLLQVALVWGVGVTLAIYATRHLSCAHLNPAVSLAMVLAKRMEGRLLPGYLLAQLVGGILGGALVFVIFGDIISQFEAIQDIARGEGQSVLTAMMFGEYFPNPGNGVVYDLSLPVAMVVEAMATFLLVTMIFSLTEGCNVGRPSETMAPVFIGATVTVLIALLAPLTQCGMNPARDFGPRLVAWLAGWGEVAIPGPRGGFFWVYIFSPFLGGVAASLSFRFVITPLMAAKEKISCQCGNGPEEKAEGPL
ncbi:MAG: MIP family channel protein [Thermodesulfobacteriota bacterium]